MRLTTKLIIAAMLVAASAFFIHSASSSSRSWAQDKNAPNEASGDTLAPNRARLDAQNTVGAISGRVLDTDSRPVSGLKVIAENIAVAHRHLPSSETDQEGEFLLKDLEPGQYVLHTRKEDDGYPRSEFNLYDSGETADPQVAVSARQTTQGVVLRLGPRAALLTGQVVDAITSQPLHHADITVRLVDKPDRFLRTGLSLPVEKGGFKLLVPSLPFTLKVSETGYQDWYYKMTGEEQQASALRLAPNSTKVLLISLQPIKR